MPRVVVYNVGECVLDSTVSTGFCMDSLLDVLNASSGQTRDMVLGFLKVYNRELDSLIVLDNTSVFYSSSGSSGDGIIVTLDLHRLLRIEVLNTLSGGYTRSLLSSTHNAVGSLTSLPAALQVIADMSGIKGKDSDIICELLFNISEEDFINEI